MGQLTTFSKGALLSHIFRTASAPKPTALYVALLTSASVELSGGGYARVQHGPGDAFWRDQSGGNGVTSNIGDIVFPAPSGAWGQAARFRLIDESGNVWLDAALASPKNINAGDPAPTFADGVLVGTFS